MTPTMDHFLEQARAAGAEAHTVAPARLRVHLERDHAFRTETWAWDAEIAPLLGLPIWEGDLYRVAGAVVRAHAAVAETGQVVVEHLERRPREWTLLVPALVVIVPPDRLVPDLVRAAQSLALAPGHAWVFVRGPSATADIEKRIVRGVHGPQRVAVCVLTP